MSERNERNAQQPSTYCGVFCCDWFFVCLVLIKPIRRIQPVAQNFLRSANRPALLFTLVPLLVETEPAENITFVIEQSHKKLNPNTGFISCCTSFGDGLI